MRVLAIKLQTWRGQLERKSDPSCGGSRPTPKFKFMRCVIRLRAFEILDGMMQLG
jgi:hypothetical protein